MKDLNEEESLTSEQYKELTKFVEMYSEELAESGIPTLQEMIEDESQKEMKLKTIPGLHVLKKSKFYMNGSRLREHIATYKNYAIMLKQEKLKENTEDDELMNAFPSLIDLNILAIMKKVNGNIIRKINPETLHKYEKMALIQQVVDEIDNGI